MVFCYDTGVVAIGGCGVDQHCDQRLDSFMIVEISATASTGIDAKFDSSVFIGIRGCSARQIVKK